MTYFDRVLSCRAAVLNVAKDSLITADRWRRDRHCSLAGGKGNNLQLSRCRSATRNCPSTSLMKSPIFTRLG